MAGSDVKSGSAFVMENYFVIFQWHKKALVAGAHCGRKIDIAEISVYGMIRKEIISPENIIIHKRE